MKLQLHSPTRPAGFALLMVLIMVGVSLLILAGDMNRSQSVAMLNVRNNDFNAGSAAAEGAVEKVFAKMAYDFQSYGVLQVSNNLALYRTNIPNENPYWNNFIFSDARGNNGRTYVNFVYNYSGPMPSAYLGLNTVSAPVYRIVSNVVATNSNDGVIGTAQEDVLLALVPLTTWAIFYNGTLEFTGCAAMTVNGQVHANGPICVGTSASLTFNGGVSTTGTLTSPQEGNEWGPYTTANWNTTFNDTPSYTTNVASVNVTMNMTNSHFLIDIPPAGQNSMSATGQQQLYNQAEMILLVTNAPGNYATNYPTVTMILQASVNGTVPGNDPAPVITVYTNANPTSLATNLPFLSLTNQFYDQRQYSTNMVTQVDVGVLGTWAATNSIVQGKLPSSAGLYPTILYVGDQRTYNASNVATRGQMPTVRLTDGPSCRPTTAWASPSPRKTRFTSGATTMSRPPAAPPTRPPPPPTPPTRFPPPCCPTRSRCFHRTGPTPAATRLLTMPIPSSLPPA